MKTEIRSKHAVGQRQILLIDDHAILREGLRVLINQEKDWRVCAEIETAENALAAIATHRPDLVILDISFKKMSGLDLLVQIRRQDENLPVLILSMHSDPFYVEQALANGANGYVMKHEGIEHLVAAMRKVLEGQVYVERKLQDQIFAQFISNKKKNSHAPRGLTLRELEVLQLIGRGSSTAQIAQACHISAKTVESHRENIKRKLGLLNAAELAHYAYKLVEREVQAVPLSLAAP